MSHSIITLKLILATAGIIDPLNVCHNVPVKKWTGVPWRNMLVLMLSALQAASLRYNPLWFRILQTFQAFCWHFISHSLFLCIQRGTIKNFMAPRFWGSQNGQLTILLWNEVITAKQWVVVARLLSHPITVLARHEAGARQARTSAQAKPIHQHSKRLSESTAQVPLTRAFV